MCFNEESLIFKLNDKKRSNRHFFIKETSQNEFQSRSSSKNNNIGCKSQLPKSPIYHSNHDYLVKGIQVFMALTKVTVMLIIKGLNIQESCRYGYLKVQCP